MAKQVEQGVIGEDREKAALGATEVQTREW